MGDYLALIDYVTRLVRDEGYDLVVLDTLGHFLPVDDENDAAKMMKALIPLNRITDAGAALLINNHPRKSQGEEGLSTRGSGALAGFASIPKRPLAATKVFLSGPYSKSGVLA